MLQLIDEHPEKGLAPAVGSRFSDADILVGHNCFMATHLGLIDDFPVLLAYYKRLCQRPGYQRVPSR